MINATFVVPLIVFGVVAAGVYALFMLCSPYWLRVRSRVTELNANSSFDKDDAAFDQRANGAPSKVMLELQRLNPYHSTAKPHVQQLLAKAGIYDPAAVSMFFVSKTLLMIIPGAIALCAGLAGYLSMELAIVSACVLVGFGSLAPSFWLGRAVARRHLQLQKSLPDFLDVMTVCLGGGLSLQETIRRVSDELRLAHPGLASELGIVQRDMELGATVDQALKRFATRTDYEGVRTLSTFIREAQRFGTDIVDALRCHADMLRSQREQAAEECAQKASVKILIPTLLLIFPAIFVVLVAPAIIQIQESFLAK
jgi:tight adherence protein C